MYTYLIIIERAATGRNYGAYCPDLPGCVATGATIPETRKRMAEAVRLHIAGMIEDGEPIPEPSTIEAFTETVEV
jgi:predicted RNase H-like HicB family nuclease